MGENWIQDYPQSNSEEYAKKANSILVMGIVSLICGTVIFIGTVGLVMGIINLLKANKFIKLVGPVFVKVRIGKGLSIAAIVFGSVITLYWLFFLVLFIADFISSVM
jgi:hypothetical protein